jgi:hypothetical protein
VESERNFWIRRGVRRAQEVRDEVTDPEERYERLEHLGLTLLPHNAAAADRVLADAGTAADTVPDPQRRARLRLRLRRARSLFGAAD